jgi:Transposase IS4
VATGPLPECTGLNKDQPPELPDYVPSLNLRQEASESLVLGLSEFKTFQQLITPAIINDIMTATNSYAARVRKKALESSSRIRPLRSWNPVDSTDIWRYIGCLLYIGNHIEKRHKDHWLKSGYLKQFINLKKFQ